MAFGAVAVVGSVGLAAAGAGASHPARAGGNDNSGTWNPDPTVDSQPPTIPSTVSVAEVQTWMGNALELRSQELQTLQTAISNANDLPGSVRSSLNGNVGTAANGIAALTLSVSSDSTLAALRSDAAQMIDERVFAVVEPQVKLVLGSERQLAIAAQIGKLEPGLETAIKTAEPPTSKAGRTLQDLDTSLSNGLSSLETSASGVVADMLAQAPSDYADASVAVTSDTKTVADDWATVGQLRGDVGKIVSLLAGQS